MQGDEADQGAVFRCISAGKCASTPVGWITVAAGLFQLKPRSLPKVDLVFASASAAYT